MCSVRAVAFFLITIILLVLLLIVLVLVLFLLWVINVTDLAVLAGSTSTGLLTFLMITDFEQEPLAQEEGPVAVTSLKADVSTITFTEEFHSSMYTAASLAGVLAVKVNGEVDIGMDNVGVNIALK
ncbi:hypothetical protein B0H14DRAFT_2618141 [Mycena olivaceomarginata]|nr:hypothetical protein B0H14DRAFT_2618141 [Mycena olivaceomarginata]